MASVDKITAHLNGGAPVTCLEGFGKVIAVGKAGLYGDLFDGDMDIRKKKERLFQTPLHGVVDGGDAGLLFEKVAEGTDRNVQLFRNAFELKRAVPCL